MVDTPLQKILKIEPKKATVQELGYQKIHYENCLRIEYNRSRLRKLNIVKNELQSRQMKLF